MKLLMTLMAMLFFASYAVAQDDPCANESGAGYGLCNAYCVAMNCDDPELQEASFQACEKVAANYAKITGNTLSCDVCPCFSQQEFDDILSTLGGVDICSYGPGSTDPYIQFLTYPNMELSAIYHYQTEPPTGECIKKDGDVYNYVTGLSLEDTYACLSLLEANSSLCP